MSKIFNLRDFGAQPGGAVCTKAIQAALDAAAACGGQVLVPAGTFVTGALFLKSNTTLILQEGATLQAVRDESAYPLLPTRVAGVEMAWPAALFNIRNAQNVSICGVGTVNGQGDFWWEKYWGKDRHGGMRKAYEAQGLRWAVDYDCFRVRNVAVWRSSKVQIEGIRLERSGFWNLHLCYGAEITVRGVTIADNQGPSTDGIDIDSCRGVVVESCQIACNDDNICLKSGRDADGLRVNQACEDVLIRHCTLLDGEGITLGSETSGGIRNVRIENNTLVGTKNGLRLKSAKTRGGTLENIAVQGLTMRGVARPFTFQFNWYPAYSYCAVPAGYTGPMPEYWAALTAPVPPALGLPHAKNITIQNVKAARGPGDSGPAQAFDLQGLPEAPFENIRFENIAVESKAFGEIQNVCGLTFDNVCVTVVEEKA